MNGRTFSQNPRLASEEKATTCSMLYYVIIFRFDSYYLTLGYRQGTKSCFALTDIRTNQQRTNG